MSDVTEASVRAEVRTWLEAQLEPGTGFDRVAQQTCRFRLGCAALADGVAWQRPVCRPGAGGGGRSSAASVPSVSPRLVFACWPRQRSWRMAPTCRKPNFLRRSLTGEDTWCQLFSEPGSGSDVAGAVTRGGFARQSMVVNGQKVWTTSAHKADWGLLLARTDWDKPKHAGLSYFHSRHENSRA